MHQQPKIGLVTVLYNGKEVLSDFFESVAKQTYKNFIVYIIDNSPNDEAVTEAQRCVSLYNINAVFIKNNDNVGVAKGNNQGIKAALENECEYTLLINNDTVFKENLLQFLLNGMLECNCEMIVPKMYYYDEPSKIWCAGGDFKKINGYITVHYGENSIDDGKFKSPLRVNYCPTCCMMISKSVFYKIGFMDEKYFVYSDDADFCYRALQNRIALYTYPSALLWHKVSSSTGGILSDFYLYYGHRNLLYFIKKHMSLIYYLYAIVFYQCKFIAKLILQKWSLTNYITAQKGFCNGIIIKHDINY